MTHPQQTTREVIEQLVEALDHCMGAITERGLNGSPDQAEKWGLQLPLERAYAALAAGQQALEQTQVEAELSRTDVLLEECKMDWSGDVIQIKAEHKYEIETLRAQLAALQSDDELPEPVGCGYVVKWSTGDTPSLYMEGYANVIGADVYTADQLRQAQAMVRAKMVPLEKDAARLDWYEANATHVISVVDTWYSRAGYLLPMTKRKSLRAAIDAAMGITGEPK